jgi:plasmid stability protein
MAYDYALEESAMSSITVRKIDEGLKKALRVRAAKHGRSMEDEVRTILRAALATEEAAEHDLGTAIRRRFARFGDLKLEPLPRDTTREPPTFDK